MALQNCNWEDYCFWSSMHILVKHTEHFNLELTLKHFLKMQICHIKGIFWSTFLKLQMFAEGSPSWVVHGCCFKLFGGPEKKKNFMHVFLVQFNGAKSHKSWPLCFRLSKLYRADQRHEMARNHP